MESTALNSGRIKRYSTWYSISKTQNLPQTKVLSKKYSERQAWANIVGRYVWSGSTLPAISQAVLESPRTILSV